MEIVIRGQNVAVSDALLEHCLTRAGRAFRPFSSHIARVQLVFVDLNGPKRGLGYACRATVDLSGGGHVRYEGRAVDYYRSISQAVAGLARQIQRALMRRRTRAVERASTLPPAA